ncbi:hypothetical protein BJ166DRAFT_506809 [Pestalotiopsis sp. NC0098]|nr:hypothetical protein BJ166DRAFT_506809 [Pestalotiopsis sp. NC0098]
MSTIFDYYNAMRQTTASHIASPGLKFRRLIHWVAYHVYSIWLFTFSDIKTIIVPSLLFALFTAPGLPSLGVPAHLVSEAVSVSKLVSAIPRVLFWVWINLLPFNIDNQRQQDSILEDKINKPWRTLASGRMKPTQARNIMMCLYPVALLTSLRVGGTEQCVSLMALGFWYNDLRGADCSWVVRNIINAAGFNRFTTGALDVLLQTLDLCEGHTCARSSSGLIYWQFIIAFIVFSTVQTQDMYDQEGDAERGRATMPLVIGDALARKVIAVAMVFWSVLCPAYVGSSILGFAAAGGLGGLISVRCLLCRSVAADKTTFLLWNMWLTCIYLLPLLSLV